MTALDAVLLVVMLVAAVDGLRHGFVRGLLSLLGAGSGALVGLGVWSVADDRFSGALLRTALLLVATLAGAFLGRLVGVRVAERVAARRRVRRPLLVVDALGGAALGAAVAAVLAWFLLVGIGVVALPGIGTAVASSAVLTATGEALPAGLRATALSWGDRLVAEADLGVGGAPADVAAGPAPAAAPVAAGAAAQLSVVKVTGTATACGLVVSGTGIVYAPERVLTAAHVVGGVRSPTVVVDDETYEAEAVLFDPAHDVAVLAVPGLDAPALRFREEPAGWGEHARVAGFPGGGTYDERLAVVLRADELVGPGWDGTPGVVRDVYVVQGRVLTGNSGGPLLDQDGLGLGMVFAVAKNGPPSGYVLTAAEVADEMAEGLTATEPVRTGSCREE